MSVEIQRAPAGTCAYVVKDESGKNCECGGVAQWRGRTGARLLYCDHHGRYVSRSIEVIAINLDASGRRETLKPWRESR